MKLKKTRRKVVMLGVVACLLLALSGTTGISTAADSVLYAKPSATGSEDCSDWLNACTVHTALGAAGAGDEIWVAAGTHKPTDGTDREASFQLKNGVAVYGGFGGTETIRDERDWTLHETILSGDIGAVGDDTDNSYHVVTGSGMDATAVLDGFTITGGNAEGGYPNNRGGGMYNDHSSPTLTNVTFTGNSAHEGGGMYNAYSSPALTNITFSGHYAPFCGGMSNSDSSSPTLTDVAFTGNSALVGGGMCNADSSPTLVNVTFSGNSALEHGGGIYNVHSSPTLTNVTFTGNSAVEGDGGGMRNYHSSPVLTDVTFSGNSASEGLGGGMYNGLNCNPTLSNVTFSGNSAGDGGEMYFGQGGGMYNTGSSPTLTNVTFSGNFTNWAGGGMYNDGGSPSLTNVTFSGNSTGLRGGGMANNGGSPTLTNVTFSGNSNGSQGGGMDNNGGSPTLTNVTFSGNSAPVGGGMYNNGGSPTLTDVTFSGNSANYWGGGMCNAWDSSPTLTNVTFSGNSAGDGGGFWFGQGGGMYNDGGSSPTLTNVTFSGNSADEGGGMYNRYDSNPTLTNVTFSGNSADEDGGGMYNRYDSSPTLTNSILWGNTAPNGPQICNDSSTPMISYSLVEGSGGSDGSWDTDLGTDGGGNIDVDPQFVDGANGDLHLQGTSPAINAGDNGALPADTLDLDGDGDTGEPLPIDLDGNPRIVNGTVDMGAYECQVVNHPPEITADTDPVGVDEGDTATNTGTVSDPDGDTVTLSASVGTVTNNGDGTWSWSFATTDGPDESQEVTITADDGNCGTSQASFELTVHNVPPAIGPITAPTEPVNINDQPVTVSASFSDPGGTHDKPYTCTLDYDYGGDGSGPQSGTVTGNTCAGEHTYSEAGVYTVLVTVTDKDGDLGEAIYQFVVVYDPSAGFVTGGGWIWSEPGAYTADPELEGKATFGFVSRYKRGASVPTGQTEFQFRVADLNFHSTEYDWLVIAGARAQYKGSGTINGSGDYGFMLTAIDGQIQGGGGTDKFRIKIWDKNNDETIVYDNKPGESDTGNEATELAGGSIVIHKK